MKVKGVLKTCSKGHVFYKSSDCPTCPVCWPAIQQMVQSDFPALSAPALRALDTAGITSLKKLSKHTVKEVLKLHGMGPASIPKLRSALKKQGLSFKQG